MLAPGSSLSRALFVFYSLVAPPDLPLLCSSAASDVYKRQIQTGSIFGEVGLISGRRRGATVVAASDCICVEISRNAALKLQSQVPSARRAIERISTERQLLQMFGSGLTSDDVREVVDTAKIMPVRAGEAIITAGPDDKAIHVLRLGSLIVENVLVGTP